MTRSGADVWRLRSCSQPHRPARLPSLRHRRSKRPSQHPLSTDSACAALQLPLQPTIPRKEDTGTGEAETGLLSTQQRLMHLLANETARRGVSTQILGAPTKTRVSVTHMHMHVYTHRPSFRWPDGGSAPTGCSHGARPRTGPPVEHHTPLPGDV